MDFLELSRARYSVLEYADRPVDLEMIDKMIEAEIAAPTACNNQPQRILIKNNAAARKVSRGGAGREIVFRFIQDMGGGECTKCGAFGDRCCS